MKKSQIKVFEELLASEDFKGKAQLKHLLWLNTSKPKFKVGDCFKVTDRGHKVLGFPVIDFNAKVVKVYALKTDNEWYYEMEMNVAHGDRSTVSKHYTAESELLHAKKSKDNINTL